MNRRYYLLAVFSLMLAVCGPANAGALATGGASSQLSSAQQGARQAIQSPTPRRALSLWLQCAQSAYLAMGSSDAQEASVAAELATQCTDAVLTRLISARHAWSPGTIEIDKVAIEVEFRTLSPYLRSPLTVALARHVSMAPYKGQRHAISAFGVPLVVSARRCHDAAICALLPPEGVFRGATAWIEFDPSQNATRLVLVDPSISPESVVAGRSYRLSIDSSAPWAKGARTSKLKRLAIWGLLRGNELGRRAGLYLLEDYDPNKRPIVMIHGLGSSPLIWAQLSNAVWADPGLRSQYQVWHLVYQSNAPLLVARRRAQAYLDNAWRVLDPDGDDPARSGIVLVGHSLGGVIAKMLCVESGNALWDAAFLVPPEELKAESQERQLLAEIFFLHPYPGVERAIFMATPHRGSPNAGRGLGRLARVLVGRRVPEIRSLRHIAKANPDAVQPSLRRIYQRGWVNSISTLQTTQPVRAAGEALRPASGIRYHTIAGALPGREPKTDGAVPLDSAVLDGAVSTLTIASGHKLYDHPAAVEEVLRILRTP